MKRNPLSPLSKNKDKTNSDDVKDIMKENAKASDAILESSLSINPGYIYLIIALTGFLQTHILSCLLGVLICLLFGLVRIRFVLQEKRMLPILKTALCTIILNAWYLFPFLYFYKFGGLGTDSVHWSRFSEYSLLPVSLFGTFTSGDYRMYSLGVPILAAGALFVFCMLGKLFWQSNRQKSFSFADVNNQEGISAGASDNGGFSLGLSQEELLGDEERFSILCLVLGIVCIAMCLWQFPGRALMGAFSFWDFLFTNLQFPWRLLGIPSFLFPMLGGIALFSKSPVVEFLKQRNTSKERLNQPVQKDESDGNVDKNEQEEAEKITVQERVLLKTPKMATGIMLCLIAFTMVPRYDTSGGDYYAFKSYASEYSLGHYNKLIGIPKTENTIVYPYEWMPENAGEEEAKGKPEVRFHLPDQEIVDYTYTRNGTTTKLEYVIGTQAENAYVDLPLFYYPVYGADDGEGGDISIGETETGLIRMPLNPLPGTHSLTITYQPPLALAMGMLVSLVGTIGMLVYIFRFNSVSLKFQNVIQQSICRLFLGQ